MKCHHGNGSLFFAVDHVVKPRKNGASGSPIPGRYDEWHGTVIGCGLCGESRTIWEDGDVVVNQAGKDVK